MVVLLVGLPEDSAQPMAMIAFSLSMRSGKMIVAKRPLKQPS